MVRGSIGVIDNMQKVEDHTYEQLIARLNEIKGKRLSEFSLDEIEIQHRGSVGHIVEYLVTGNKPNNRAEADIISLGIEIKTSQAIKVRKIFFKSKERLTLNMIDYDNENWLNFYESSYFKKNKNILLLILASTDGTDNYRVMNLKIIDYMFIDMTSKGFENDLKVIMDDYETIASKVLHGEAHLLSEGDTLFLGAATKAANSTVRRRQPYSDILAKPRAFTYKQGYISGLIAEKLSGSRQFELLASYQNQTLSLAEILRMKILRFRGKSLQELFQLFGTHPTQISIDSKSIIPLLIKRILSNSKSDEISELLKADISIKTIRVHNNRIKESMSFPRFKFTEIINEEFEDSSIYNLLYGKKFLFVIFVFDKARNELLLHDVMLWNMPFDDLEQCKVVFDKAKHIVETSTHSFSSAKNSIMHVRPHGRDGLDTDTFPDGTTYTKQCFWLYNHYILKQIEHITKNP